MNIVVGPRVLMPNYSDKGRLIKDEFKFPIRIDLVLINSYTYEKKIIKCITNTGIKAHTYNQYPQNHPNNTYKYNGTVKFEIESGLYQTGVVYPNASNVNTENHVSEKNMDGSMIEFDGRIEPLNPNNYFLSRIIVHR